jgi:hypothetical protein
MASILVTKELALTLQPLLLAEITLKDGSVLRLSTHALSNTYAGTPASGSYQYDGHEWLPRIINQDLAATQAMSDLGIDMVPSVTLDLSDPDKHIWTTKQVPLGFKGATVRLLAVMFDPSDESVGTFTDDSPAPTKFIGRCTSTSVSSRSITITATNLLNMQQAQIPPIRIQPTCPWIFPINKAERVAAATDPSSLSTECGYSPDVTDSDAPGGTAAARGNYVSGSTPYTSCTYDYEACVARMGNSSALVQINQDVNGRRTGVFGGYRFIPEQSSGRQRPFLTGKWEEIINASTEAKYGDYVPMAYGTTWLEPLVMGAWANGNYSNFEVLICYGEINKIRKVVVNGQEISRLAEDSVPSYRNLSEAIPTDATTNSFRNGYWKTINNGGRHGLANPEPGWGKRGDPYGSVAAIYVSVLSTTAAANSIPKISVLLEAQKIRVYSDATTYTTVYSENLVWQMLDVLTWCGWRYSDIDIASFVAMAAKADAQIYFNTQAGTYSNVYLESGLPPARRFSGGFSVRQRRSAGELIRALRNATKSILYFDYLTGKLKIVIKETLASQQPSAIAGSNYNTPVPSTTVEGVPTNGYVAYRFNETNIIKEDGQTTLSITETGTNDSPNKVDVRFQNRENAFSLDRLAVVDTEDVARVGNDVAGSFVLEGPQTFDHIRRVSATWFAENFRGNSRLDYLGSAIGDTGGTLMFEFKTTIKGIHLGIGQICLFSDQQHGIDNQLIRITRIQPSMNFETVTITAAWHNDNWYLDTFGQANSQRYTRSRSIVDRRPFTWGPNDAVPVASDAYFTPRERNFSIASLYESAADGSKIAKIRTRGTISQNFFPDVPGRPKIELTGAAAPSGGYPASKTYFVGISAKTDNTTAYLLSPMSKPAIVTLGPSDSALSFNVLHWPDNPSGWVAFAGEDPSSMTYQASGTGTPGLITLTNDYNEASWGAPDELFSSLRFKMQRSVHSGIWAQEVTSVTTSSVQISMFNGAGFVTNEYAGREISVLGVRPRTGESATYLPIVNFPVGSNTSDTVTASAGNFLTCVDGGPLLPGDVVVMRLSPVYGEDGAGKYFEDTGLVNPLNSLDETATQYSVVDATNASPIVVTVDVPIGGVFPFVDGDYVVVQGVGGNTAAVGIFAIDNADSMAGTFELVGSTGSGAYTSGGTASRMIRGLVPNAEKGFLAYIYAGTGQGTAVKIKSNTSTRYYIDGDWPILPDASTRIIILDPALQIDLPGVELVSSDPRQIALFDVEVNNYLNKTWFVRVQTQDASGNLSPEPLARAREIYLFGETGALGLSEIIVSYGDR